jgi:hypothetical protein
MEVPSAVRGRVKRVELRLTPAVGNPESRRRTGHPAQSRRRCRLGAGIRIWLASVAGTLVRVVPHKSRTQDRRSTRRPGCRCCPRQGPDRSQARHRRAVGVALGLAKGWRSQRGGRFESRNTPRPRRRPRDESSVVSVLSGLLVRLQWTAGAVPPFAVVTLPGLEADIAGLG